MAEDTSERDRGYRPTHPPGSMKEEDDDDDGKMQNLSSFDQIKSEGGSTNGCEVVTTPEVAGISKKESRSPSITGVLEGEEIIEGDVTLKLEPGKPPKLARAAARKVEKRPPTLVWEYEDKTAEATSTFSLLDECVYANKSMGTTEHALECDCAEEWDSTTQRNYACGEDSDCINRATKMECVGDCGCGNDCQNQRFQRREYAKVAVIKTEKKGYGLRVETDLKPNDFIFEYIGEVIGENVFRRRMQQYDEEGIKHFYFMSLNKGEFVDATKRGNLGRFCNHSCNPNCYVDKWVVGDKLRMGIFAERRIQAGEELVFNYNVDRYGADPQPCYCGEGNCSGYIGGKTQTGGAIKLSHTMIEALGIEDAEALDNAATRKQRRKKTGEEDEEYVNKFEPRGLDEEGVNKVMSSLMQCKERWIAIKLLARIQRADDERVWNRVVRFHGYRIMKTVLSNFDDVNLCLQVLDVLDRMPRLTRNKIQDSKIEDAVAPLVQNADPRVTSKAAMLLDAWSKLEIAYRIPRMKRDPQASLSDRKTERRDVEQRPVQTRSKSPEILNAPTGPRNKAPSRPPFRPKFRPPPSAFGGALPTGWFEATAATGATYYYTSTGTTTWTRPIQPAASAPPPPPPRAVSDKQTLQDLIKNIVSAKSEPTRNSSATATPSEAPGSVRKEDKWKSMPEDKRKKIYEGSIQPHIMHVVSKYKQKLPKDDLKRWARELAKKMVESDFRKGKVENPSKLGEKQIKGIRKHAQEFFEKAAKKRAAADLRRDAETSNQGAAANHPPTESIDDAMKVDEDIDEDVILSDIEEEDAAPNGHGSPSTLKRVRESAESEHELEEDAALKRLRTEPMPRPPPPPPPPDSTSSVDTPLQEDGFLLISAAELVQQTATPPTTGSPMCDDTDVPHDGGRFSD